ncbi:MAG: hemolysin family protein [Pseudomonadota bacterium]
MTITVLIIVLLICLLLEGFFSGSEMAVVNADKYKLALATDAGSRRARLVLHLVKHPADFFATTLLGTNICLVTASVMATFFIIDRFGPAYAPFALLYSPIALIFGEIVPKSIYQHHADRIVLKIAPILLGVSFVLYPVVWIFSKLTDLVLGGIKRKAPHEQPISKDELEIMIDVGGKPAASDVEAYERTLISRLFDLEDKKVRQIMTPLVDVVSISAEASREEACRVLDESEFSRVPIIEGDAFNVVGVLTGTDLLFGDPNKSLRQLMRPAYYVPEEMPLDELLVAMKRGSQPIAVAVDEYGAATGIATVEDLMEEVVGEISDEHDELPPFYKRLGRHKYLLSGRLEIEHANERLSLGIPEGPYQTIAGYMMHVLEHIPKRGESFRVGRFTYMITRSTDRAVLEVEVVREADKIEGGKS